LVLLFGSFHEVMAEKFPDRPVTLIINYSAGGATDIAVRPLAKVAEQQLGMPIIVVNRPGGGGSIGTTELARAKADGYTIGTLTIGATIVVPMMQQVGYHPFRDFEYICGFGRYIYGIFVRTDSPFKTLKDAVEAARANPGKVTYGTMSPSIAIALKFVEIKDNIKFTYIPYQSGAESSAALVGGHVNLSIGSAPDVMKFIEAKEMRALAAVTEDRWSMLPNVPTMQELGYDIDITGWMSFGAPAGVPRERLDILYKAFKTAAEDQGVKALYDKVYVTAPYTPGEEMKKIYQKRQSEWKPLIEAVMAERGKK
jgi:tripartite-type tricarboxylate transporter receptor subunit TctC